MPTTFVNIQDEVLARDYGATAERTNVKLWINDALNDVHNAHRFSWAETTSTLTSVAGTETVAVPTDLLWVGRVRPAAATSPRLTWIDPGSIDRNSPLAEFNPTAAGQRGMPRYITRWGASFYLDPTPDAVYTWTLYYWKTATALSSDSDAPLMPVADREILVYGALARAAERDRQWDAAQYWKSLYDEKLAQMKAKDVALGQGPRKVPMPSSYYGRYDRAR